AADDLAARIGELAAVEAGHSLRAEHPVGAGIADGEEIADGDVEPYPVVAAAGLQEEDGSLRIRRQAVGEHASRRAGADDDVVERFPLTGCRCHAILPRLVVS